MDVGAFGKGEALDRVASVLGAGPWLVDLGGQVSVGGRSPGDDAWAVAIADPRWRDRPVLEVRLSAGSLSTSAGSERDHVVGGRRVGHILDPRSGQPAAFTGSVTVWHQQGLAADALSTALFVMGPEEGLRWSESRNLAVLYLIPESGTLRVAATREFRALMTPGAASADGNERDLSLVGFDRFVGGHR
jgi:thiamine biosynthesis lipoprotein